MRCASAPSGLRGGTQTRARARPRAVQVQAQARERAAKQSVTRTPSDSLSLPSAFLPQERPHRVLVSDFESYTGDQPVILRARGGVSGRWREGREAVASSTLPGGWGRGWEGIQPVGPPGGVGVRRQQLLTRGAVEQRVPSRRKGRPVRSNVSQTAAVGSRAVQFGLRIQQFNNLFASLHPPEEERGV